MQWLLDTIAVERHKAKKSLLEQEYLGRSSGIQSCKNDTCWQYTLKEDMRFAFMT